MVALKKVELGLPVAGLILQLSIYEQTCYRSKKSFAGLEPDQVRELIRVVEENGRLKNARGELAGQWEIRCLLPANIDIIALFPEAGHQGRCLKARCIDLSAYPNRAYPRGGA